MDKLFLIAFKFTKANEGGFSNRPDDAGGATIFGITMVWYPIQYWRAWRAWKAGKTEELERVLLDFYYTEFWNPRYEQLLDKKLAVRLYDLSVNFGKKTAIRLLQQTVNNISNNKLITDGKFGDMTLTACNYLFKLIEIKNTHLYEEFVWYADQYYKSRPTFNIFGKGWLSRLYKPIDISKV